MNRRSFFHSAALAGAGSLFASRLAGEEAAPVAAGKADIPKPGSIYLSVKWGMIDEPKMTLVEKFRMLKELGYDGAELDSPGGGDKHEIRAASFEADFPVHGSVDSIHWNDRLSSPDEATRQKGLEGLITALRETKIAGGDAVLLVPGRVDDPQNENAEQVWERSIAGIRLAIPTAAKLGVRILIENVWNGFLYDPRGGDDQGAEQLVKYLDEIASPWVGSYFDIGNHRKFGKPETWIRQLGPRIVKLDVKDWGKEGGFVEIGAGDVNWPEVRKALAETGYTGWATAEVGGGNAERLAVILKQMQTHLLGQA